MNTAIAILRSARPNFLLLTVACVLLGLTSAHASGHTPAPLTALLVMAAGLLAHAAVNLLNDWEDFRSGLDLATDRTPFSGGSGVLPSQPESATAVLIGGIGSVLGVVVIGAYLVRISGPGLIIPGLLGIALVVAYTPWITRRPVLCLIAPGLGFGPLMVGSSYFAITGAYSLGVIWASLTPLFLVSGLLLINQFPDVEPDREFGRRHLPIVLGRRRAARLFAAVIMLAFVAPLLGVVAGVLPVTALLVLLPAPIAGLVVRNAINRADDLAGLQPWLGANVGMLLATIVLLAIGVAL
jgi:1,4-dihydroxy-2-naphthoate polyprenyltransferase